MTSYSRRTMLSLIGGAAALTALPASAWMTAPAAKKTSVDVLVIGGGLSGIVSALSAQAEGAKVLLIDKARKPQRGGNSRVCLGSFLMPQNDDEASIKSFVEDVKKKSLGGGRTDLYEVLGKNILNDVKWLESLVGKFEHWLQANPWTLGVRIASPGQYKGMPVLLETLHKTFESKRGRASCRAATVVIRSSSGNILRSLGNSCTCKHLNSGSDSCLD